MSILHTAQLRLPADTVEDDARALAHRLENESFTLSLQREDGIWTLALFSERPFEQDILGDILTMLPPGAVPEFAQIDGDRDWLSESYRSFPPFTVGPFFVHGSHYDGAIPTGALALNIDAATAFGSGEHGTTKACLMAMDDLNNEGVCPWNVLDMGTGSGILAIAAYKLWKTPVLAVDNDPECARVAALHRDCNRVPDGSAGMICVAGDGFATPDVGARGPFDLIIANILAPTLREMEPDLTRVSDTAGHIILSGILHEQADAVEASYGAFTFIKRYKIGEWTTLVGRRTG